MGLCATPIWARKQLGTRVIEGVSKVEGVTGCAGWSFRTDCPMCRVRICMWRHHAVQHHAVRGGRTMGDAADGAGQPRNHAMIPDLPHEFYGNG